MNYSYIHILIGCTLYVYKYSTCDNTTPNLRDGVRRCTKYLIFISIISKSLFMFMYRYDENAFCTINKGFVFVFFLLIFFFIECKFICSKRINLNCPFSEVLHKPKSW